LGGRPTGVWRISSKKFPSKLSIVRHEKLFFELKRNLGIDGIQEIFFLIDLTLTFAENNSNHRPKLTSGG
jgi:hypothetical protein